MENSGPGRSLREIESGAHGLYMIDISGVLRSSLWLCESCLLKCQVSTEATSQILVILAL